MRRNSLVTLGLLLLAASAQAQNLITELENRLGGQAPPAAATEAPEYGYLGFTPDEDYKLNNGVKVLAVKAGGPAEAAGLKKDDLVKSVDGKLVGTVDEMDNLQKTTKPNQVWRLGVERAGKLQNISVKLGARPVVTASDTDPGEAPPAAPTLIPPAAPLPALTPPTTSPPTAAPPTPSPPTTAPPAATPPAVTPLDPLAPAADPLGAAPGSNPIRSRPLDLGTPPAGGFGTETPAPTDPLSSPGAGSGASLGITVVPLTPEARAAYGVSTSRGALVTAIRPGSPADTAGLPIGAVIVTADGRRIDTADELVTFIRTARPGQEVELVYDQGGRMQRKLVRLGPTSSVIVPGTPPAGGGFGLGGGVDRPLINRAERLLDNLANGRGAPTVYDPSQMAQLITRVSELTDQVKKLEERLNAIEGRGGAAPPAPAPGGFGAP